MAEEKTERTTVTPPRHQVQRSGNGPRRQSEIPHRSQGVNGTEREQKRSGHMETRGRYNRNIEERRDTRRVDLAATQLKESQRHNQDLEERNRHLTNQLAVLSAQLNGAETQHQQTLRLLEAKTSELKGAQAFLTKEDSLSSADVIAMVDALNAEILQIAAFMADCLNGTNRDLGVLAEEVKAGAVRTLGEPMARSLGNKPVQPKSDDDSMGLQIALQICLVYLCSRIIESWMPGYWREGDFLAAIYSQVTERGQLHS